MLGHRSPVFLAVVACLLVWLAYFRSVDVVESRQEQSLLVEELPPVEGPPKEPFVFVDPAATVVFAAAPGVNKKKLIGPGRVPYLVELSELELELGGEEKTGFYSKESAVYYGLQGDCELHFLGSDRESLSLHRGSAAFVFPGVRHNAAHAGGRERCKILRIVTSSGRFAFSGPGVQVRTLESLSPVRTAHESDLLSKQVYLAPNTVPGLFQVSLSRFAAGATCEEHRHRSAAEVYVNYDGAGCHIEMWDRQMPDQSSTYNISSGKVLVVNPTTLHKAWNSAKTPCHNINLMIGAPWE